VAASAAQQQSSASEKLEELDLVVLLTDGFISANRAGCRAAHRAAGSRDLKCQIGVAVQPNLLHSVTYLLRSAHSPTWQSGISHLF
jgi:hypothetical protein